ncbi:MAG: hypothetical protein K0R21_311 [Anaerocolumna sp.]|jgi:hypothetical protein|nr:hypothetical protein [Anaerocolumna sp.]
MLFGRRKPGFVEIQKADEQEESASGNGGVTEGKPNLMGYLASLPDVEDEFEDFEDTDASEEEEELELTEEQKFAEYIRIRTKATNLTSLTSLKNEIENLDELLEKMKADESCSDIVFVQGNKDIYYYSNQYMSNNYAMIASLVEEKDLVKTIAEMVRFNCKTYPAPTPVGYFEKHPYLATKAQIERALLLLSMNEEYNDIHQFDNNLNVSHLYSSLYLSERYAKALARVEPYTD